MTPLGLENFAISNDGGQRDTYWEGEDRVQFSIIEGMAKPETGYHCQSQVIVLLISANCNIFNQCPAKIHSHMQKSKRK